MTLASALLMLVLVGPDDPFTARVERELVSSGVEVRRGRSILEAGNDDVVRIASRGLVEHWTHGKDGPHLVTTTALVSDDETDALVVAERVRGLTRAHANADQTKAGSDGGVEHDAAKDRSALSRVRVFLGGGPTAGTGSVGAAFGGGVRVAAFEHVTIGMTGHVSAIGNRVERAFASATLSEASFGPMIETPLVNGRVELAVGVGVWATHLSTVGAASLPFEGRSDDTWTALVSGHAHAAFALSKSVRLALRPTIGIAPVRTSVRFGGAETTSWGAPYFALPLYLEVSPWNF